MALTKRLNYYQDDNNYYRRIPWDSWYLDGTFQGISPAGIMNANTIEIDSNGVVTVNLDFLDVAEEGDSVKRDSEIDTLTSQTDERTFLDGYDDVCAFYESDSSQTYEFHYHEPARNE